MAVGAVCAMAPIEGTRWLVQRQRVRAAETAAASLRAAEPQLLAPLPDESLDGLLLATQETPVPGRLKPLERRESCLWGVPGRNPYKGTARQVLTGARLPPEVVGKIGLVEFEESGIRYHVDVLEGQKTGFFFDQRENRLALKGLVQGRRTLDCFCYVGAWALSAARHGASEVIGIDSSEKAVALARVNAALNGLSAMFVAADVIRQTAGA